MAISPKGRIADCFIDLMCSSSKSRNRIKVSQIAETLGICRKTFYNQFDDLTDLVIWIFRNDMSEALKDECFALAELDYPDASLHDKYSEMPFYARFRTSSSSLDQSRYFKALCDVFNDRESFYRSIFAQPDYLDFYRYLESLYIPAFKKDIRIIAGPNRSVDEPTLQFLSEYHAIAVLFRAKFHLSHQKEQLPKDGLDKFWNYSHDVIRATLDTIYGR